MDDLLLRQLVRQIKILNTWVTVFGTLVLVSFIVMLILIFKAVTYIHDTTQRLASLQQQTQQSLDIKTKICDDKSLTSLLGNSDICK
jgi:hypothetical protein